MGQAPISTDFGRAKISGSGSVQDITEHKQFRLGTGLAWILTMNEFFPSLLGWRCLGCGDALYSRGKCEFCTRLEAERRMVALMEPPLWLSLPVAVSSPLVSVLSLGRYEGQWRTRVAGAKGWPATSAAESWCAQWLAQVPTAWRSALWVAVPPRPLQRWHLVEELALKLQDQGAQTSTSLLRWHWRAAALGTRQKSASRLQRLAARERFAARPANPDAPPVVLYDDVTTTGATLSEAAKTLSERGWSVLGATVLAHTPSHSMSPSNVDLLRNHR